MENHEKHDIIKKVAVGKSQQQFLSEEEQANINKKLFAKLSLLIQDFRKDELRPQSMRLADKMFEETHSVFIQQLKEHREEGGNVINVLCHAIPPEVYYATQNSIPVGSCMGASELEPFAPKEMNESCSLGKSLTGFLKSGMCAFQNVANHAINIKSCHTFNSLSKVSNDFEIDIFNLDKDETIDNHSLLSYLRSISDGEIDETRFLNYSQLFLNIRATYAEINAFRKLPTPPIRGIDAIWLQQLYIASSPHKLLPVLTEIKNELNERVANGIGYTSTVKNNRILLIGNRNMPPYAQTYRLIENAGGIIVKEYLCMGVEKGNYDFNTLKSQLDSESFNQKTIQIATQKQSSTAMACDTEFDAEDLMNTIEEFKIDKVITFALQACLAMEVKQNKLSKFLAKKNIAQLGISLNYQESYKNEAAIIEQVKQFLAL